MPLGTPNPLPSVGSSEERRYARAEGIPVINSMWAPTLPARGGGGGIIHRQVHIGRDETHGGQWLAVWELEAPVAFLRTRIPDPLLCLTGSITLREKPIEGILAGYSLKEEQKEEVQRDKSGKDTQDAGADVLCESELEDINLLGDMGRCYCVRSHMAQG